MSKRKKSGERPRTELRASEREARKLVRDRERWVVLQPGGTPERALAVATPAIVRGRASATPCHQCGGGLDVPEVEAVTVPAGRRRVVRARCRVCHAERVIWFALAQAN